MIAQKLKEIKNSLASDVTLVAISKFQPNSAIEQAYTAGQRIFGESRPQELVQKYESLPKDIKWHFIGHLQTNKIKMIIPFVDLIHSIDSLKLAQAVSEHAVKAGRVVNILLQVHIATEDSKQGFSESEIEDIIENKLLAEYQGINIVGLMGMGTFTDNMAQVRTEFETLHAIYQKYDFSVLSMGMSQDYKLAIECGSNMVRIGSSIFGNRY